MTTPPDIPHLDIPTIKPPRKVRREWVKKLRKARKKKLTDFHEDYIPLGLWSLTIDGKKVF